MASDGYGAIRVSYSILNSWARGDIDRAVAPYAGVEIESTEAMEYGKKKHEAWEKETRRTGRLPARFAPRKLKKSVNSTTGAICLVFWMFWTAIRLLTIRLVEHQPPNT